MNEMCENSFVSSHTHTLKTPLERDDEGHLGFYFCFFFFFEIEK